jgi:hypothetical protein
MMAHPERDGLALGHRFDSCWRSFFKFQASCSSLSSKMDYFTHRLLSFTNTERSGVGPVYTDLLKGYQKNLKLNIYFWAWLRFIRNSLSLGLGERKALSVEDEGCGLYGGRWTSDVGS